ncbi:uncharacterized protein [Prorops nasuta]|uniref:uncharacterized protein n=1 Tax=Prorops nasuta TaxID=863751 RepID=UPI0034CDF647
MTAEVKLVNFTGKLISCRALMDTCATANFLTEDMARKLNLRVEACEFTINAIDNIRTTAKGIAKITFQSIHGQFRKSLTCLIVPHISGFIPNEVFPREDARVPSNIKLADPQFHLPQRVDLLIGSGATLSLLCVGQINLSRNECDLYAQKTLLGWVIVGEASSRRQRKEEFCRLANIIRCFAAPGVKQKKQNRIVSDECEIHYKLNTTRDSDGRYIVRLPFKDNRPDLGNTKAVAMRRFYGLIRKFKNDPEMAKIYWSVMQEYIDKGHMALVNSEVEEGYYLPHHAVIINDSITTKVRVVFDASAKGDKGVSLNEVLLTGPVIQDKLTEHLIRIRLKRYMITADIEKMYRQILVHPDDRRYQRIVWFHQNEIRTFELKTVTFGVSSSSFLAIRTLKQLAEDEGDKYPIGARVLKENLYVDDLLAGANTLQEIIKIREELIALLRKGGFKIRKWASNNPQAVEFTDKKMSDIQFLKDETTIKKTLGICWNAANDEFSYNVQSRDTTEKVTKRIILSEVAKIYDPIGLLGPITFMAKVIVQECWKSKVHWDETLSLALREKWSVFARQLSLLSELTVKRYLLADSAREIQIHGFCDASKLGYGACLYIRSIGEGGHIITRLICSRSRVASLKEISIPRMELNGALTLVRLYEEIRSLMKIRIEKIIFWCDSTIVLHWIKESPLALKTYEANRVKEIQSLRETVEWKHIRTQENPADCLSRGQMANEFLKNRTWFEGPAWLKQQESSWPISIMIYKQNDEGERVEMCFLAENDKIKIIEQFSSYSKLVRVIAYCMRFVKENKKRGVLSNEEIKQAEVRLIRMIQNERFSAELKCLREALIIKENRLASLNPFLNSDGLICVGGRLRNANMPMSQKHSILLPARSHFTDLIIREYHERYYHARVQTTLYSIRQRFWILDGKNQVRKIVRGCVRCIRFHVKPNEYRMADLPVSRVEISTPFFHTGIDFFGPMFVKERKYRNKNRIKVYGCVFICMASKAVHIEIVSELSSDAFIAALRRFSGRRSTPAHIYTDNGTNFIGANRELRDVYALLESKEFKNKKDEYILKNKINWHFNPPLSPHFGGLWEAAVKSFKHHFKRVIGDKLLTLEEINTFAVEIEAILNSRPLCPISSDPNDPLSLTPAHLLIGKPLIGMTESDVSAIPDNRLNSWRIIQKIRLDFWRRWQLEYLSELQKRSKWFYPGRDVTIGSVVLLIERNQPCMHWSMGRILEVHPGDNGVVRVVTLRTAKAMQLVSLIVTFLQSRRVGEKIARAKGLKRSGDEVITQPGCLSKTRAWL